MSGWTGHVIVCGLHDVSLRTVEQLFLAGVPVVVIDDEPEARLVAVVQGWGIPYIPRTTVFGDRFSAAGLAGASAVICAESTDLATLETALQVRNLRPDVRAVVHLDNPAVGGAVEGITGAGSVLDVAGLFAPSVVDACLGRTAHELRLEGELFVAAELRVSQAGTLRELYGDLAPIGVLQGSDETLVACPGRDLEVHRGDQITLLGTPQDFETAGVEGHDPQHDEPATRRSLLHRTGLALRSAGDFLDSPVRWTLLGCLVIFFISTLVLRAFYDADGGHMTWIESLYFTIETAATVGFGDFSFRDQAPWLQIFAIWLIIDRKSVV